MTLPAVQPSCWPVDTAGCDDFSTYDAAVKELAEAMAAMTMKMLTGRQMGNCPIVLRPCSYGCVKGSGSWLWTGGTFVPVDVAGVWLNMVCSGCGLFCSCGLGRKQVTLPGIAAEVVQVKVDGAVLPTTAYRLDSNMHLVRLDGQEWPSVQAMDKADTEVGTWSIEYVPGYAVDGVGARAAGILACQFARAIVGGKCELPRGVTQIARQGIVMTLTPGAFPNGLTGIQAVDAYITAVNPHLLKEGPALWSPDMPEHRVIG